LKTEYFGAFPAFELEMLNRGYYVAHIKNTTRWCLPEDTDAKAFCVNFSQTSLGFSTRRRSNGQRKSASSALTRTPTAFARATR
jgi:hypothetical protein